MLVASYTPFALPGYLVATAALLLLRRGVDAPLRRTADGLTVAAVLGVVLHLGLLAPSYLGGHPDGPVALTVATINLRLGHADAATVVRLLDRSDAQVAVLEEVTPGLQQRLAAAGIGRRFPYTAGAAAPGGDGTLILSSYRLEDADPVPLHHGSYQVRVAAPTPFWLVGVHLAQPISSPSDWRRDWGVLNAVLPRLDGSVVVAGDLNSTLDHGPVRELIGHGFADAARTANTGWQPTWPSGRGDLMLPNRVGLLTIDHVLTRGAYGAVSVTTSGVRGSDHRALVARLALR